MGLQASRGSALGHADPCSQRSAGRGESLHGQAPPTARGWVLIEHPGPWGPDPAVDSRLLPEAVRHAAREHGLRLHLIRRPDRGRDRSARLRMTCLLASGTGKQPFIYGGQIDDPREVLDAGLDRLALGLPPAWGTPVADPLYLVCTHGKVDVCCAREGLPVARRLAALAGDRVWETTHVGGCRFAANVICLPHGIYYGRVRPDDVGQLVAAADHGRVAMPWYRGRAGLPPAAQLAEIHLRRTAGLPDISAITFAGQSRLDGDTEEVRMLVAGTPHRLVVRREILAPQPLKCGDERLRAPVAFQVIEVTTADPVAIGQ